MKGRVNLGNIIGSSRRSGAPGFGASGGGDPRSRSPRHRPAVKREQFGGRHWPEPVPVAGFIPLQAPPPVATPSRGVSAGRAHSGEQTGASARRDLRSQFDCDSSDEDVGAPGCAGSGSANSGFPPGLATSGPANAQVAVFECAFCGMPSSTEPWYVVLVRTGADGRSFQQPDGDLCLKHGRAAAVWPKASIPSLVNRYNSEAKFRIEFDDIVCKLASPTFEKLFKTQCVKEVNDVGSETILRTAAVPLSIFTSRWQPPDSMKVVTTWLKTPPRGETIQVVLITPLDSVPSGLFHFEHILSCASRITYDKELISNSQIMRLEHASDVFSSSVAKSDIFSHTPQVGTTDSVGNNVYSIKYIEENHTIAQDKVKAREGERAFMEGSGFDSVVTQKLVGGQFSPMDLPPAPGLARRPPVAARQPPCQKRRIAPAAPPLRNFPVKQERSTDFGFGGKASPESAPVDVSPASNSASGSAADMGGAEEPDYKSILLGLAGDLGNQLNGAEARKNMMDPNDSERGMCENIISITRACAAVHLGVAGKVDVPLIRKNAAKLERESIAIPKANQIIFTSRLLSDDLELESSKPAYMNAALQTWAQRLSWKPGSGNAWSIDNYSFEMCSPDGEGEARETEFQKWWQKAIFGKTWMHAWRQTLPGGLGCNLLVDICCKILRHLTEDGLSEFPWALVMVTNVKKFHRGLLTMMWPLPAPYGAKFDDVTYVFPDKKTTLAQRDIFVIGRLVAAGCAEHPIWGDRKTECMKYVGADSKWGRGVFEIFDMLDRMTVDTCDFKVVLQAVDELLQHADLWRKKLRPGCVLPIENLLALFLGAVVIGKIQVEAMARATPHLHI